MGTVYRPQSSPQHAAEATKTVSSYALPKIGDKRVDRITSEDVVVVLLSIWDEKPEKARRLRRVFSTLTQRVVAQKRRSGDQTGPSNRAALVLTVFCVRTAAWNMVMLGARPS